MMLKLLLRSFALGAVAYVASHLFAKVVLKDRMAYESEKYEDNGTEPIEGCVVKETVS